MPRIRTIKPEFWSHPLVRKTGLRYVSTTPILPTPPAILGRTSGASLWGWVSVLLLWKGWVLALCRHDHRASTQSLPA